MASADPAQAASALALPMGGALGAPMPLRMLWVLIHPKDR